MEECREEVSKFILANRFQDNTDLLLIEVAPPFPNLFLLYVAGLHVEPFPISTCSGVPGAVSNDSKKARSSLLILVPS